MSDRGGRRQFLAGRANAETPAERRKNPPLVGFDFLAVAVARPRIGNLEFGGNAAGARLHHDYAIRQEGRFLHVVRDEDEGEAQRRPQIEQMLMQARAREGIERGERLVQQTAPWAGAPARARWRPAAPGRRKARAAKSWRSPRARPAAALRRRASRAPARGRSNRPKQTFSATVSHGNSRGS